MYAASRRIRFFASFILQTFYYVLAARSVLLKLLKTAFGKEGKMETSRKLFVSLLILAVCFCSLPAGAENTPPENNWELALKNLREHVAPIIEKAETLTENKNVRLVQYQSGLLSKYLPEYRLYVVDSGLISIDRIFLLKADGTFHSLGHGHWESIDEEGTVFHSPKLNAFLAAQKFKIEDEQTAIDFAELIEELSYAPDQIGFLRTNTKNYTLYRKDLFEHVFTSHLQWEYYAEKTENGYTASRKYIGPPASTMAPQIFSLELNEKNELVNITARHN